MNKFFALSLFVAFALLVPTIKADQEVEPQVTDGQEVEPMADKSAVLNEFCSSTTDFIFEDLRRRGLNTVPDPIMKFLNDTAASHRNARDELVQFVQNPGEGLKRFAEQQKSLGQKLLKAPSELFNQAKNATEQADEQLRDFIKNRETHLQKLGESLARGGQKFVEHDIFFLLLIPYFLFRGLQNTPEVWEYNTCVEAAHYNWKIIRRFEKLESENSIVCGTEIDDIPCFLFERIRAIQRHCSQWYKFPE